MCTCVFGRLLKVLLDLGYLSFQNVELFVEYNTVKGCFLFGVDGQDLLHDYEMKLESLLKVYSYNPPDVLL